MLYFLRAERHLKWGLPCVGAASKFGKCGAVSSPRAAPAACGSPSPRSAPWSDSESAWFVGTQCEMLQYLWIYSTSKPTYGIQVYRITADEYIQWLKRDISYTETSVSIFFYTFFAALRNRSSSKRLVMLLYRMLEQHTSIITKYSDVSI